ncbi:MAG: prepilin-type N-terminal cleavage/methylation domain-containing protein [Acidobacteriota bacterium]|nr:prepilin-type N-terminal cleavage/methylation domain-containing protein [Acidobacteriota bacterium]
MNRSAGARQKGFTLLEVMVATVIMGIAVAGLIAGLSQSVKNASRLTEYDRAAMLARTKMNDLLLDVNLPFDGTVEGKFDPDQSGGVPSGWRASLRPFDVPPRAGPGTEILQRIALELWWQPASGTRRTIQLESYRRVTIPIPAAS